MRIGIFRLRLLLGLTRPFAVSDPVQVVHLRQTMGYDGQF